MVLESYGYKFLRINRFNLGNDPVATLSDRLYALIDAATKERDAQVVTRIRNDASGLKEGTTPALPKMRPGEAEGVVLRPEAPGWPG